MGIAYASSREPFRWPVGGNHEKGTGRTACDLSTESHFLLTQKKPRVRKIFRPILGPIWPRQFSGRLGFLVLYKIPRLGGGGYFSFFFGGGGKCQFYFYGRGIYLSYGEARARHFFNITFLAPTPLARSQTGHFWPQKVEFTCPFLPLWNQRVPVTPLPHT